eukprot:352756-Chlamydomonas_euryale.AAC.5
MPWPEEGGASNIPHGFRGAFCWRRVLGGQACAALQTIHTIPTRKGLAGGQAAMKNVRIGVGGRAAGFAWEAGRRSWRGRQGGWVGMGGRAAGEADGKHVRSASQEAAPSLRQALLPCAHIQHGPMLWPSWTTTQRQRGTGRFGRRRSWRPAPVSSGQREVGQWRGKNREMRCGNSLKACLSAPWSPVCSRCGPYVRHIAKGALREEGLSHHGSHHGSDNHAVCLLQRRSWLPQGFCNPSFLTSDHSQGCTTNPDPSILTL